MILMEAVVKSVLHISAIVVLTVTPDEGWCLPLMQCPPGPPPWILVSKVDMGSRECKRQETQFFPSRTAYLEPVDRRIFVSNLRKCPLLRGPPPSGESVVI